MVPHLEDLDPPPSGQQTATATAIAGVRDKGRAGSRSLPRRHEQLANDRRDVTKVSRHAIPASPRPSTIASTSMSSTSRSSCIVNGDVQATHAPSSSKVASSTSSSSSTRPTPNPSISSVAAAGPSRTFFDPWNSSSTGHQRAENRLSGSTSWRDSRNLKLREQYSGGLGGGKRVADTVGAGSEEFGKDGRKENGGWERGAKGLRGNGQKSLVEVWGASKSRPSEGVAAKSMVAQEKKGFTHDEGGIISSQVELETTSRSAGEDLIRDTYFDDDLPESYQIPDLQNTYKQIFSGLCFYLNGSTAPIVSDHKLKRLLAERGANMSIALGRRSVTHVILGTANMHGGCGGGLAATKIQREIARTGGKGVKFVNVEWILESIKADRRLPEAHFAESNLNLASKGQNSVYGMFQKNARKGVKESFAND